MHTNQPFAWAGHWPDDAMAYISEKVRSAFAHVSMQEAHTNGVACLVSCPQDDAERYCEGLRGNGLISTIEPAGGSGSGPEAS